MEKKGVFGPGDCEDTILFAENLPYQLADIANRHGNNKVDPENITTKYGGRISSFNLEEGVVIPGVKNNKRDIRRDIFNEIGEIRPIIFVPEERQSASSPYQQRQILEYC